MNSINKFLISIFILGFGRFSCYAQFNTIEEFKILSTTSTDTVINKVPEKKEEPGTKTQTLNLVALPLKHIEVTSNFGKRFHPITKEYRMHNGIDLRAKFDEVYSMLPGIVYRIGENELSGKYIIIATGNHYISYCHLSDIDVRQGLFVYAGVKIGRTGNSGRTTGPHLHITYKINGELCNPIYLIEAIKKKKDANS